MNYYNLSFFQRKIFWKKEKLPGLLALFLLIFNKSIFHSASGVNSKNFPMPDYCAMLPISNKENSRVMLVLNKNLHAMVKTESLTPRSVNLLFPPITNATKEIRSEDEQNIYGLCSFVSSTTG